LAARPVYRDYYALHLAPRAFLDVVKYAGTVETAAHVDAINTLIASGPSGTRELVEDAASGGNSALADALPGNGLSQMALRDLQIARQLAALWNISAWGGGGLGWAEGVVSAGLGMESGVWYTWPARQLPGRHSDVEDQLWYARAVSEAGTLVVTRELPCLTGCAGQETFMAPYQITLSIAFADSSIAPGNSSANAGASSAGASPIAVAPTMGVMMVSYMADYFQEKVFKTLGSSSGCSSGTTTCFLMDSLAFIVAHPDLPLKPTPKTAAASSRRQAAQFADSATRLDPAAVANAGVFVGEVHGSIAQEMMAIGLLVQRTTKGASRYKNGMVYEMNMGMLAANGGEVGGIVTRPDLGDFVVRQLPGSNLMLVMTRHTRDTDTGPKQRIDYCGTFSNVCPSLTRAFPADLGENSNMEELANECNSRAIPASKRATRVCPVPPERIVEQLWSDNASSGVRATLSDLRIQSGQQVCKTWVEKNLNVLVAICVVGFLAGIHMYICISYSANTAHACAHMLRFLKVCTRMLISENGVAYLSIYNMYFECMHLWHSS